MRAFAGDRLRIAIIASSRFPIGEPFAGGLEAHVWMLTKELKRRGHLVSLFAAPGSDPTLGVELLSLRPLLLSEQARKDVSMSPGVAMDEHHAYLSVMMELSERRRDTPTGFDVIHNHSLHYLPVAMAPLLGAPMVSTLHTPPTPWLESAVQCGPGNGVNFVGVSGHTARSWRHVVSDIEVIHNGVDTTRWRFGPGGGPLVWSGRLVPEKDPVAAIQAARLADQRLDLAGPIMDRSYFDAQVAPLLGAGVRYLGHLDQQRLSELVRHASAALVTPAWDEPYGLVVAEALSSGTPVAAFARGGIPEILDSSSGCCVAPGDVSALADAIPRTQSLSRAEARQRAETHCSAAVMVDRYERLFHQLLVGAS